MDSDNAEDLIRAQKGISYPGISTTFFCHDGKGKFFLAKRSNQARDEQGTWDMGGGSLDPGLTLIQNVEKEIMEEYGAKAKDMEYLGHREVFRQLNDGTPTHWISFDFAVHLENPNEVKIMEPHKFDDSGWFTLGDLPEPMHSVNPHFFEKYSQSLSNILNQPLN